MSYRELAVVSKSTVSEVVKAASFLASGAMLHYRQSKRESLNNNKKKRGGEEDGERLLLFATASFFCRQFETIYRARNSFSHVGFLNSLCSKNSKAGRQNVKKE